MNRHARRAGAKLRRQADKVDQEIARELKKFGRLEDLNESQRKRLAELTERRAMLDRESDR